MVRWWEPKCLSQWFKVNLDAEIVPIRLSSIRCVACEEAPDRL